MPAPRRLAERRATYPRSPSAGRTSRHLSPLPVGWQNVAPPIPSPRLRGEGQGEGLVTAPPSRAQPADLD
ncbi:MAG: hypothetical protein FJX72_19635, partial [Armatimonadetes bacterium]|nr:hypothetical protein [Armatimonadota bacterium]